MDHPRAITRPDPALHKYYLIVSLAGVIFFPLIYIPLLFRYRTLRYRFDEDGVSMSWGRFFERETYLTYRRIQDIQVTRGVIQRRLGLADLELQTASGGSGAEMKIEGIRDPDRLRDFLYERMRGAADDEPDAAARAGSDGARLHGSGGGSDGSGAPGGDEVLDLLREIRDELRRVSRSDGAE
ncbi:hypothetical protein BH23GEM11_BH23GEM11_07280 [soil metagenome]